VLINRDGLIKNAGAFTLVLVALCLMPLIISMDTAHHIPTAVYSLFGGIVYMLASDFLRYSVGITTNSNPLKSIPTRQFDNAVKLLQRLCAEKRWTALKDKEITQYLIRELNRP
jgi:hypothetical protein